MNGNSLVSVNANLRKRAPLEPGESEHWPSMAATAAGIGLWALSADGASLQINARLKELLALEPGDELSLDRFVSCVHAEDRERVRTSMLQALDSPGTLSLRYRIVRPDGTVRWMDSRGSVLADTDAGRERLMGMTADITEHKEYETQLHQALEEFQQFHDRLQMEKVQLSEHRRRDDRHDTIAGQSEPVLRMLDMVKQVAPTDSAVL
ncbi:MAG TPA: PAS domain-containing protein, partial [Bacteroidota bacterium]|nr:PAS domain-containing protein [Bacteroidota bacterium]